MHYAQCTIQAPFIPVYNDCPLLKRSRFKFQQSFSLFFHLKPNPKTNKQHEHISKTTQHISINIFNMLRSFLLKVLLRKKNHTRLSRKVINKLLERDDPKRAGGRPMKKKGKEAETNTDAAESVRVRAEFDLESNQLNEGQEVIDGLIAQIDEAFAELQL